MKIYFAYKKLKVIDCDNKDFAIYEVLGTGVCFNQLNEAVMYCIGIADGNIKDTELRIYIDTFLTMVKKNIISSNVLHDFKIINN